MIKAILAQNAEGDVKQDEEEFTDLPCEQGESEDEAASDPEDVEWGASYVCGVSIVREVVWTPLDIELLSRSGLQVIGCSELKTGWGLELWGMALNGLNSLESPQGSFGMDISQAFCNL